jgi:hypothetical protein
MLIYMICIEKRELHIIIPASKLILSYNILTIFCCCNDITVVDGHNTTFYTGYVMGFRIYLQ